MKKEDIEMLKELLIEFRNHTRPGDILTRAIGLLIDNCELAISICNKRMSNKF